ncbi:MAG: DUF2851 family protein [Verrucomicrobiota bacterium]
METAGLSLTLQEHGRKSNGKVLMITPGLYAQSRARSWAAHALAERPEGYPLTEKLLQLIWQHQRLRRDNLRASDGRPLTILHPGFWNHEPGPDFQGAVIQFGEALARNGDVEVDLAPQSWRGHGHDHNAAYKQVILHVVWEADANAVMPVPTLAVRTFLDASLDELASTLRDEAETTLPNLLGKCALPLQQLSPAQVGELVRQAACVRLECKGRYFQARAKQVGWQAALWEGLFGALGYKKNVWPMRRLAELLPALTAREHQTLSTLALQARLLGVSGLLPSELGQKGPSGRAYLQQLWNIWWREREHFAPLALPRDFWHLSGLRPANNPQRRLALAAHWLAEVDLPARLEEWFATDHALPQLPQTLFRVLETQEDEYWSRHLTFHSLSAPAAQPLIGAHRVTDLAVNVIIPWLWVRAAIGRNTLLQQRAEKWYFAREAKTMPSSAGQRSGSLVRRCRSLFEPPRSSREFSRLSVTSATIPMLFA